MLIFKLARAQTRVLLASLAFLLGCGVTGAMAQPAPSSSDYRIGPGDNLNIFVWQNPQLTSTVPVRPDGKISIPLVEDVVASGSSPSELARIIETRLAKYITNPNVTVLVSSFGGSYDQQIRILGEATQPKALLYKNNMTVLDAMIEVGGLTRFAAGNRATLVRKENGRQTETILKLDDMIKDGDVRANVPLKPGDIIIIPQSYF